MPAETDKKRNHVIHTLRGTVIRNYHATIFPAIFYIWILEFHKNLFRLKMSTQRSFVAMDLTIMLSPVIIVKYIMVVALT